MVKNDPNYKREKPWVYINASDAHCVEKIGSKTSYVSLDKKNFESLLRAYLIEECDEDTFVESNEKFILLYLEEEYKDKYSLFSILAWLKSSAFIWYMTKISRTLELYEPPVFRKIIFPCISAMEKGAEIEKLVRSILDMEKQFLIAVEEQAESADNEADEDDVKEVINQMVDEHNDRVIRISKQIDEMIFNALEVSERQKRIIIEDLDAINLFNYLN